MNGNTWRNYLVNESIFSLNDDENKAVSVTPKFLKVNLKRGG